MLAFEGLGLFSQPIFFRYEMHDVTKSCITIKGPFEMQDRPMDFNITGYKVQHYVFRFHIGNPFRKLPLLSFSIVSIKEEYFQSSVHFPTTYLYELRFLLILQPNSNIATG